MTPTFEKDASLTALNTLRVPARAAWLAVVEHSDTLESALASPQAQGPVLVLGEGSNLLFTGDYPGLVLRPLFRGIERAGDGTLLVGAGENWHAFVRWSLAEGYAGLENLALIPGSVGAAPIQNIGAYGVEVERFIRAVVAWDRVNAAWVNLDRDACGFGYRDSVFRRSPDRYIVTRVDFTLSREPALHLDYAGLREALSDRGINDPTPIDVAEAVEAIRRRKLPDPEKIGNVGSFFKNPVVTTGQAAELAAAHPGVPAWPVADGVKLSAAWLLEKAGFKGARKGDAGFSPGHALVLVNHGSARGSELLALAKQARQAVAELYGVRLEIEPRVI